MTSRQASRLEIGFIVFFLASGLTLGLFTSCASDSSDQDEAATATDSAQTDGGSPEDEIAGDEAGNAANGGTADSAATAPRDEDDLTKELAQDELGGNKVSSGKTEAKDDLAIPPAQAEAAPPAGAAPSTEGFASPTQVNVKDVLYLSKKNGGTVVVETSAPATFHTREVPEQNQVVLEIANASLPDRLRQPFLTKDFNQAINSISAYQEPGSSTVRVVVQFRAPNRADVKQDGNNIELSTLDLAKEVDDNPTIGPTIGATSGAAASSSAGQEGQPKVVLADNDPHILPATSLDPVEYDNIKFYGKPISLEVRDISVREVINVIAEQSGANIVLGDGVDGNISLKLRKIPWDQALLIVMKTKGLGYIRQGSILRVAKYDALKKEAEEARAVSDARKAAEPTRVRIIPVGYAQTKDLVTQLAPFLTLNRGKAIADIRTNSLIITDVPEVLDRIGSLIKALDIPPLQVLIEGKVVEATENFERDVGFNFGSSGQATSAGSQSLTTTFGTQGGLFGTLVPGLSLSQNGLFGAGISAGTFPLFGTLSATLSLAEINGSAHTISSPRVMTVNNEKATIVQSVNIVSNQSTVANGVTITSPNYTPVETRLEVTPQVTSENDVIMTLKIKRDFAAPVLTAGAQPNINHREAETHVLVRNGQTAVIGGVYQNDDTLSESGVPGLKDVPVVGWLFKAKSKTNDRNELLVFLTPRILNSDQATQKGDVL